MKKKKALRKFIRFQGDAAVYWICCNCVNYEAANYKLVDLKAELNNDQYEYCPWCGRRFTGNKIIYKSSLSIVDVYQGVTLEDVVDSLKYQWKHNGECSLCSKKNECTKECESRRKHKKVIEYFEDKE